MINFDPINAQNIYRLMMNRHFYIFTLFSRPKTVIILLVLQISYRDNVFVFFIFIFLFFIFYFFFLFYFILIWLLCLTWTFSEVSLLFLMAWHYKRLTSYRQNTITSRKSTCGSIFVLTSDILSVWYTLKMLGKFSWVIVGWLKKFIILGNYYPIEPSSDLTYILGNYFYLNIERIFTNSIGNGGLGTCCPVVG